MRDWEFVELLREYIVVNRTLRSTFARFRKGEACFPEVAALVGDSDSSILFRLKERCHALFRKDPKDASDMHREVLFDLTVGSLFHEAMKLRENLYQNEVYVPQVQRLFEEHGPDNSAFFMEFEKVQEAGPERTQSAMHETESLLKQTRNQLRSLLASHADDSLMTRNLFENREAVEMVFESDLADLLSEIYPDASTGFAVAADSFLESAFFVQATACLDAALAEANDASEPNLKLAGLRTYAQGMEHFSKGAFERSLDSLEDWLEHVEGDEDPRHLRFAESALSRFGKLVGEDEDAALRARAEALVKQIDELLPAAAAS